MFKKITQLIVLLAMLRGCIAYVFNLVPTASMAPTIMPRDFIVVNRLTYNLKVPMIDSTIATLNQAKRGDIVIFKQPNTPEPQEEFVKRVIGIEGDHIHYDQKTGLVSIIPNYERNNCKINHCEIQTYRQQGELNYINSETSLQSRQGEDLALIERTEQIGNILHSILLTKVRYDQSAHYFKQNNLSLGEWIVPEGHYFVMGDFRENSIDSRFFGFVPQDNLMAKAITVAFNPRQQNRVLRKIQ
ncbi:signal peptidase I [Pasteurella bettyae]|uniref:signal peptidase I n=1 Tax=Pasteurella bettyae TaxID=752 RepID=UPI003D29D9E6